MTLLDERLQRIIDVTGGDRSGNGRAQLETSLDNIVDLTGGRPQLEREPVAAPEGLQLEPEERLLQASVNIAALEDPLFQEAPTNVSKLRRLNQVRRQFELPELDELPPELGPVGALEEVGQQFATGRGLAAKIPFAGEIGTAAVDLATILPAADRAQQGEATKDDLAVLADALERSVQASRERTGPGTFVGIASQIPTFGAEFFLTGGAGTVARKAATKAAAKVAGKVISESVERFLAKRGIKGLTDVGAQMAAMTAIKTVPGAVKRALPEVRTDENHQLVTFEGEKPLRALTNAGFDVAVEVLSERSGQPLAAIGRFATRPIRKALRIPELKLSVREFFNRLGLQGPATEIAEERLGEIIREGATRAGIVDLPQEVPTLKQILAEAAAFAIPGAAAAGLSARAKRQALEQPPAPPAAGTLAEAVGTPADTIQVGDAVTATEAPTQRPTQAPRIEEARQAFRSLRRRGLGAQAAVRQAGRDFGVPEAEILKRPEPAAPAPAREIRSEEAELELEASTAEELQRRSIAEGLPIEGKGRTELLQQIKDHAVMEVDPPSPVGIPKSPLEAVGFVPIQSLLETTKEGVRLAKVFAKRFLRSRGDLPKEVFQAKITRDGWIERQLRQMRFIVGDLQSGIKRAYGGLKNTTTEQLKQLDQALKGQIPLESLPEPVRGPIGEMRSHIDAMSRHLVDEGFVEGDLASVIDENIGVYVTRSYEVFTNPNWSKKVSPDVLNKAEALLRSEFPEKSEEEIKGELDGLLYIGEESDSPIAVLNRLSLGGKDLSILRKRKGIPPEIRALWGEFQNPLANYAVSVQKMATLIANNRFLATVREEGLGNFLFEDRRTDERGQFITRIADEGNTALEPLDGLFTTPEIKEAMKRATEPQQLPDWLRHYMKINGAVKFSKTVLSLMTNIRNVMGNVGFATANGHWRVWKAREAVNATLASFTGNDRTWREYFLRLAELGVVADNARQGELKAVLDDAMADDVETFMDNSAKRKIRRAGRITTEVYRAEDDVWKVYAFENEKARYGKAHPEWSLDQLERHAANIVRNTYPTYSMIPEAVTQVRRFPLVGTFVSFPAEVVRVTGNTLGLIRTELSDPATRDIGIQRLAGTILAASGTAAIAAASRQLMGITRDHDEDKRRFLPPWSQNSQLLHMGSSSDGTQRYIDISYVDPYEYIKKPLMALLRGEDLQSAVVDAGVQAMEPFLGEEILAERVFDVLRNKKKNGGPVYNPQGSFDDVARSVGIHLAEPLEPGTLTSARRVARGLTGFVSPYGRSYDPTVEALAVFTGQRVVDLDVPQSLKFRASQSNRDLTDARSIFKRTAFRRGEVGASELVRSLASSERSMRTLMGDLHKTVAAAQRLGVQKDTIQSTLKEAGLSREERYQAISGEFLENGAVSDLLYQVTSPTASDEVVLQGKRALLILDQDFDTLRPLLLRESRWRSGKLDSSGKPLPRITKSMRLRLGRLRRLVAN